MNRLLEWDSQHFGFPVARVEVPNSELASLVAVHKIRCAYFLADASDLSAIRWAEANRFELVDLRVTLAWPIEPRTAAPSGLRPGIDADREALRRLSGTSFLDSRFFVDARFPRDRVEELFRIWSDKCLADPNGAVLVAESGGKVAGFIGATVKGGEGEIVLVGVDAAFRGQSVGSRLIEGANAWLKQQGVSRAHVVTQGRNRGALALYQRQGYLIDRIQLQYHLWT